MQQHIYVKDIANKDLKDITLPNNDNRPVTFSRDTQEIPFLQGIGMSRRFIKYELKTNILQDFKYYDDRERDIKNQSTEQIILQQLNPNQPQPQPPNPLQPQQQLQRKQQIEGYNSGHHHSYNKYNNNNRNRNNNNNNMSNKHFQNNSYQQKRKYYSQNDRSNNYVYIGEFHHQQHQFIQSYPIQSYPIQSNPIIYEEMVHCVEVLFTINHSLNIKLDQESNENYVANQIESHITTSKLSHILFIIAIYYPIRMFK